MKKPTSSINSRHIISIWIHHNQIRQRMEDHGKNKLSRDSYFKLSFLSQSIKHHVTISTTATTPTARLKFSKITSSHHQTTLPFGLPTQSFLLKQKKQNSHSRIKMDSTQFKHIFHYNTLVSFSQQEGHNYEFPYLSIRFNYFPFLKK